MSNSNESGYQAAVIFMMAETPVHAGSGAVLAALDLPIQRSAKPVWPNINDSTVRGSFRRHADAVCPDPKKVLEWFGSKPGEDPTPGRLSTPDAELLLFPVAAPRGLTAWVTCVPALRYFQRKLELFDPLLARVVKEKAKKLKDIIDAMPTLAGAQALATSKSEVVWSGQKKLILEADCFTLLDKSADELADWFTANAVPLQDSWWTSRVNSHLVVVPEYAFKHYVKRKTDVRTRVQLADGQVNAGPWTEENLPVDTLLYTVIAEPGQGKGSLPEFVETCNLEQRPVLQLGGDQNLGRGLLRLRHLEGNHA
jgi:CRISPR-associated protein Cmr4